MIPFLKTEGCRTIDIEYSPSFATAKIQESVFLSRNLSIIEGTIREILLLHNVQK